MTICVSVKVGEGLILAADSAVAQMGAINTPQGQQFGLLQTFLYANKVARIKDYPIGVLTWGLGAIQARSIHSLVMEYERTLPPMAERKNYTVRAIADSLFKFVKPRYDAMKLPPGLPQVAGAMQLGLLVGGFSADSFFADLYHCTLPNDRDWQQIRDKRPDGNPDFGTNWFGMTDAADRLILGFDRNAIAELVKRGADKAIVEKWLSDRVSEMPIIFDGMPLQDAIEFADYLVQVTIGRFRFGIGAPVCGGDVDIAVITPAGFKWAKRKQWAIKE